MSELTLRETFAALSSDDIDALKSECEKMSADFTPYQVDFHNDLLTLSDILAAKERVAELGMQAEIDMNKVAKILFDTTNGFLVSCILQQPMFVALVDGMHYLISGRHRATALEQLMPYGLSGNTLINCVIFETDDIAVAMSMVLTSNGSRAVTKGENQGFKLARFGVKPEVNDCLRAGRDGTLSPNEAFMNACWFSYVEQEIGSRTITTVQGIAKSVYALLKKRNYTFNEIAALMDDVLYAIEEASDLTGVTNVARGSGTIAENIIEILEERTDSKGNPLVMMKESASKKQAKRNVKATLFSKRL